MHLAKISVLALLMWICVCFSSCAGFNPVTEDLMRPPRLTPEQKAIEDALLSSVATSDISFKYPQKGNHRSAFIFQDLDADGQDEAIVFYQFGGNTYSRLSVLDRDESGNWKAICELSGLYETVDFISFANLSSQLRPDILVGWSDPTSGDKRMEVYAYESANLSRLMDGSPVYDEYLVDDLDQNGTDDLFLFSRNSGTREQSSWVHLMGYDGYRLGIVDELPLSHSLVDFAGVTAGRLTPNDQRRVLFIDEVQAGGNYVTEVFGLQAGDLIPIIHYSMVSPSASPQLQAETALPDEAPVELPTLYELTVRPSATAICGDINNDGIIEIPTSQLLPGYEDLEENEHLFLTEYNQLYGQTFRRVLAAVTNRAGGYRIRFPSAWIGNVTVVSQPENNEWRLIAYNGESPNPLGDLSGELLRIRVVSQKDYQDKFLENYTILATRNVFTYYAYIPDNAFASLHVTMQQLQNELFSLL